MKSIITSLILLYTYFGLAQKDTFKAKVYTYENNNLSSLKFKCEEVYNPEGKIIKRRYSDNYSKDTTLPIQLNWEEVYNKDGRLIKKTHTNNGYISTWQYFYRDSLIILYLSNVAPNDISKISCTYNTHGKCVREIYWYWKEDKRKSNKSVNLNKEYLWKKWKIVTYKYNRKGKKKLEIDKRLNSADGKDIRKHRYYYDNKNHLIEEREYENKELTDLTKYKYNDSGYVCLRYYFGWPHYKHKRLAWRLKHYQPHISRRNNKKKKDKDVMKYDEQGRIVERISSNGNGSIWIYE